MYHNSWSIISFVINSPVKILDLQNYLFLQMDSVVCFFLDISSRIKRHHKFNFLGLTILFHLQSTWKIYDIRVTNFESLSIYYQLLLLELC